MNTARPRAVEGQGVLPRPARASNRIDHLGELKEFLPDPADASAFREIEVHGHTDQLYFPAKLYCGQSLLDSRRESVIIDLRVHRRVAGLYGRSRLGWQAARAWWSGMRSAWCAPVSIWDARTRPVASC